MSISSLYKVFKDSTPDSQVVKYDFFAPFCVQISTLVLGLLRQIVVLCVPMSLKGKIKLLSVWSKKKRTINYTGSS